MSSRVFQRKGPAKTMYKQEKEKCAQHQNRPYQTLFDLPQGSLGHAPRVLSTSQGTWFACRRWQPARKTVGFTWRSSVRCHNLACTNQPFPQLIVVDVSIHLVNPDVHADRHNIAFGAQPVRPRSDVAPTSMAREEYQNVLGVNDQCCRNALRWLPMTCVLHDLLLVGRRTLLNGRCRHLSTWPDRTLSPTSSGGQQTDTWPSL